MPDFGAIARHAALTLLAVAAMCGAWLLVGRGGDARRGGVAAGVPLALFIAWRAYKAPT